MAELTPMKIQYNEIKSRHQDCILFFRLGDFYEMFDEDAKTAARELDIALTTRDRNVENPDERTPMCGVPYHSSEAYIARLIAKGYKVAICEQTEVPKDAKGLVSREVIRVITPGTVTESSMLEEGRSNYICSIFVDSVSAAVCFTDISTGELCAAGFAVDAISHIKNELSRFMPAEAVLSSGVLEHEGLCEHLRTRIGCHMENGADRFDFLQNAMLVCSQFKVSGLDELGLGSQSAVVCAVGGLLSYLRDTQKCDLSHINSIDLFETGRYMELEYSTRRNLELTENMRTGEKKWSLLWALDKTRTAMAGRLLRSWIERPLLSPIAINRRLMAVSELVHGGVTRTELMLVLREISDITRLLSKVVFMTANGRDLQAIGESCGRIPGIKSLLEGASSSLLQEISAIDPLEDISALISRAICDDPPFSVREGGILRQGFSEEVDRLRDIRENGAALMAELETRERARTGVKKLKVGYNKVFGYYIDVPRSVQTELPPDYVRKQTLVSNERYFTQELKELENTIISAKERIAELEYDFFSQVRNRVSEESKRIQEASELIAQLDVICSLAEAAVKNGYVMPEVDMSRALHIVEGRHPVVELTQTGSLFVPNDTFLNENEYVAIITGPNMAGKSTYMRQTALIVLMAQIGSFVPAKSASIGVVDRIFTRIGASDDLTGGQSTFMVEMTELASILRHATPSSLLILDEIGRGTSTFDGMAIARAVLEYCADKRTLGAKTMFATHYHELTEIDKEKSGVRNYSITAKKQGGGLVFLRKIVPGAADDSYGIEVAKLAGVPDVIITKAMKRLKELEARSSHRDDVGALGEEVEDSQVSLTELSGSEIARRLKETDINTLTPLEAMNMLYELKQKVHPL